MSWMQKLVETYDHCQGMVGAIPSDGGVPLLPICHTTQMAHVEIVIDGGGNFLRARMVPKKDARTIIPCTEESGGRTNGEAPHPLCDKLQYVARDYLSRGGKNKSYSPNYIKKLTEWCSSDAAHPKTCAVLAYVEKGCVIGDLIDHQVFVSTPDGKLLAKWEKKKDPETPPIFSVLASQFDAFIRWEVEIPGDPETKVWRDASLWESWIRYYTRLKKEKSLCYVTGTVGLIANQHPAKLVNDGDKAKLISSNDTSGFTYRGRFQTARQAAAVGFETSQKAHFALRWLIGRQGFRKGELAIVAWATCGTPIPQPTDDPLAILGLADLPSDEAGSTNVAQDMAIRLKKRLAGYRQDLGDTTDVVVIGLDAATTGRRAIIYYRELSGSDFLQRLDTWHTTCVWLHHYGSIPIEDPTTGKRKNKPLDFIGAPAPLDIAEAAYGLRADDKIKQVTVERLLPCIIDGQPIPRDLVELTVRRASNRVAMDHWEWNKTLTIACALFNKSMRKENYSMALDPERKTRDYLYGRLLALAENLELWALNTAREERETNAARLMQRFSERPYSTWRTIELALVPYKARLGGKSIKRQRMIDEVIAAFEPDDFTSDKRLSGEFLLGYHCQRESLRTQPDPNKTTEEESA